MVTGQGVFQNLSFIYRWKDNFVLINICNRTEGPKCTVFKIYSNKNTPLLKKYRINIFVQLVL